MKASASGSSAKVDDDMIRPRYDQMVPMKKAVKTGASSAGLAVADDGSSRGLPITVMGDASVEYALLKRVLFTCAQAGYRDVSMAVEYSTSTKDALASSSASMGQAI